MEIRDEKISDVMVVKSLDKRIDASVAMEFKGHMLDLIGDGNTKIVLDLSGVEFIDSSGLSAIVSSLKAIRADGDLVLCGIGEGVSSLFRLTRMYKVFQIFKTRSDAVRSFT